MMLSADFSSYGKGLRAMIITLKEDKVYKRREMRIARAIEYSRPHNYLPQRRSAQIIQLF